MTKHDIVITGCKPAAPPEMPTLVIPQPKPTAEEIRGGSFCTPQLPNAGCYPSDFKINLPKGKP